MQHFDSFVFPYLSDPRYFWVPAVTPEEISNLTDRELSCPRCGAWLTVVEHWMPFVRSYGAAATPAYRWQECPSCGWDDKPDPRTCYQVDGRVNTDFPF